MNKHKVLLVAGLAVAATACATVTQMTPISGSRADGTVRLGFTQGMFEKADIDMEAALQQAVARCRAWGYESAEPFGSAQSVCQASNAYGCTQTLVTVEYQCLGGSTPN